MPTTFTELILVSTVTPHREANGCYTLPKGDLGAATVKRKLHYVSRNESLPPDVDFCRTQDKHFEKL